MLPPSSLMFRRTTSMPTPRPEMSVVCSAVEKPGHEDQVVDLLVGQRVVRADQAALARLREDAVRVAGRRRRRRLRRRCCRPCDRPRAKRRRPPACRPRRARRGISMPWSTLLRTRCTSGSPIFSSTVLSSSVWSPVTFSSTCLPSRWLRSRTMRGKRLNTKLIGNMRTRMTLSCSSRTLRSSCARPARSCSATAAGRASCRAA